MEELQILTTNAAVKLMTMEKELYEMEAIIVDPDGPVKSVLGILQSLSNLSQEEQELRGSLASMAFPNCVEKQVENLLSEAYELNKVQELLEMHLEH